MAEQTPNQKYTARLRKEGMQLYPMWMPSDPSFKAKIKKLKDTHEKEFLKHNRFDEDLSAWVSIRG